jgi:hypothetical protein
MFTCAVLYMTVGILLIGFFHKEIDDFDLGPVVIIGSILWPISLIILMSMGIRKIIDKMFKE